MSMHKCRYQGDRCDNWTSDGLRWGIDMVWDGPRDFDTGLSTLVPHPSPICRPCFNEVSSKPIATPPFWHARDISDMQFLEAVVMAQTLRSVSEGLLPRAATQWDVACVLAGRPDLVGTREGTDEQLGVPPKVLLAKAKRMIRRGLIAGCACGCRGDWEVYEVPDGHGPLIPEDQWQAAVAECDCDQPDGLHAMRCRAYQVAEGQYMFNEEAATFSVKAVEDQRNPEQDVLDAIDQLVDEQMAPGPRDDYSKPYTERCPKCGGSWHGLQRGTCPGATGIEGNPMGGENRQLVVARADEGHQYTESRPDTRNPVARAQRAANAVYRFISDLTETMTPRPPGRRPEHPTELVHVRLDEQSVADLWSTDGGTRGINGLPEPLRTVRVLVRCRVRYMENDVWEYQVQTSLEAPHHHAYQGVRMTREFLQSGMSGLVSAVQLTYLPGFSAGLVVESDGTVVADIMRPDGVIAARMGFAWEPVL